MNTFQCGAYAVMAMGLLACASTAGPPEAAFPVGRYASGEAMISFAADGGMQGAMKSTGQVWGRGRYRAEGPVVTMTDEWYADGLPMPANCVGVPGRYRWTHDAGTLSFQVIEDACAPRIEAVQGQAWSRID